MPPEDNPADDVRTEPGEHRCMADGCDKSIPVEMAFCRPHWKLIPYALRSRLSDAFANWQRGGETMEDSKARVEALRAAQQACRDAINRKGAA